MAEPHNHIDKPEPRWQALLGLLAVVGIFLALPKELIVGPVWLLPALLALSIAPTVVSHRTGRHSLNHALGILNNTLITVALMGSVALLISTLPSQKEPPIRLLISGAELWLSNVLLFSLWYWRLDGGGPTVRDKSREFGSRSFVFPQMQIEKSERERYGIHHWRPRYVDYLFIAFTQSSTFGPTDVPLLARWAKFFTIIQVAISLCIVIVLISRAVGVL